MNKSSHRKIAIPVNQQDIETEVASVFGRAAFFCIYDLEKNDVHYIENAGAVSQGGAGIKAAQCVVDAGVDLLFAPQCGDNAAEVIHGAKIDMYQTLAGTVLSNIAAYRAGKLEKLENTHSGFHNHGEK